MKKRNIILVSLISIIVLTSSVGYLIVNNKSRSMVDGFNELRPYWGPLEGKEVNINEAQSKLPFKVVLPNKFEEPTLVKLVEENNFLYVIYSDKKPTPDMGFDNIIDSGAIVLTEYPSSSAQENDLMIDSAIETIKKTGGVLEKVAINGHQGVYGGNIEHVVYWFIGTTNFEIIANPNIPFSYLVEMAGSVMGN